VIAVLTELGLVQFSAAERSCRLLEPRRTELEHSSAYRACRERLAEIERVLAPEIRLEDRASAA
jgi:hypothetical protein